MPDLRTIVNRMIEQGDSDEDIEGVINRFQELHPPKPKPEPVQAVLQNEPGDFWGGVKKSFTSGEASKAGLEGAFGFLKGAVADIPETLWSGVKDAAQVAMHPIDTLSQAPEAFSEGLPAMGRAFAETTANAGADPESFGRMMGQLTGQPAIMAGAAPFVKPVTGALARGAVKGTGAVLEGTGRVMKNHAPVSGMIPRLVEPRIARVAERAVGRGVESLGKKIRGTPKASVAESAAPKKSAFKSKETPPKTFEPSVDPAETVNTETGEITASKSKKDRFYELVDKGTSGTITAEELAEAQALNKELRANNFEEPPAPKPRTTRSQGEFRPTIEPVSGKALIDRVKEKLTNLGSDESGEFDMDFWKNRAVEEGVSRERPPTNPLRPEVPEGQVTNQRMLELLDNRAAEERMAAQSAKPSLFRETEVPGATEFSPDLVQNTDNILEGVSPRFEAPEPASIPDDFYPDFASGGTYEHVAPTSPAVLRKPPSFMDRINQFVADESGSFDPEALKPSRLVKGDKVIASNKPVGPKGQSWSIHDPNGKHLGDINVSPTDVAEALKTPGLEGFTAKQMADAMFEAKRDELLESHGLTADDLPRLKIASKNAGHKVAKSTAPEAPAEMATAPIEEVKKTLPTAETNKRVKAEAVDPDVAFGRGGNIDPIVTAASDLEIAQAPDLKYKPLLPKSMQFGLGPGETFRQRLSNLIEGSRPLSDPRMAGPEARMVERDKFIQSVLNPMNEPEPTIPPLDISKIDVSKLRKGKINQQPEQWVSPRMQQQFPTLARRLKEIKK